MKNKRWVGAIPTTWQALGMDYKNVAFGYANLGTITSMPFSVTASGVPYGTALYAEIINPSNGQVLHITPNSEAGIFEGETSPVPEPGSLALLGTGLVGIATQIRRKLRG